jgi:hypothetical protein
MTEASPSYNLPPATTMVDHVDSLIKRRNRAATGTTGKAITRAGQSHNYTAHNKHEEEQLMGHRQLLGLRQLMGGESETKIYAPVLFAGALVVARSVETNTKLLETTGADELLLQNYGQQILDIYATHDGSSALLVDAPALSELQVAATRRLHQGMEELDLYGASVSELVANAATWYFDVQHREAA